MRTSCVAVLLTALAAECIGASPATTPSNAPSTAPADPWPRLTAPDFTDREKATNDIWSIGESVRPRLIAEAQTGSLDKRERCRRVLWLLDLGIDPALPPAAVDAVTGYSYDAPENEKRRRVQMTMPAVRGGSPVLLRLGLREPSASVRQMIFAYSGPAVVGYVDGLIDRTLAADTRPAALADLDAYVRAYEEVDFTGNATTLGLVMTDHAGRLAEDTAVLSDKPNRTNFESQKLARLVYAAGRDAGAIAAADASFSKAAVPFGLAGLMRIQSHDWAGLLRVAEATGSVGARAACLAVSGKAAAAADVVRDALAADRGLDAGNKQAVARVCLLNGLIADGVEAYAALGEIGVLRVQGRWAEALAVAAPTNVDPMTLQRFAAERDVLRREAGLLPALDARRAPAAGRPTSRPAVETDWQAAADAFRRDDFQTAAATLDRVLAAVAAPAKSANALAAGPGVRKTVTITINGRVISSTSSAPAVSEAPAPLDPIAVRAAAERLKSICLGKLGDADAAAVIGRAAELRCAARPRVAVGMIERLDGAGLDTLGDVEADRLRRRSPQDAWAGAAIADRAAGWATRRKQWPAAADARDTLLLWHATDTLVYSDPASYLRGPYQRLVAHAHAALAAGDTKAAVDFARRASVYLPTEGGVAIAVVPALRTAGETAAADELFETIWAKQTDLCRQYPKAAVLRNSAAWTALRCDRHLDMALTLAGEAVTLRPDDAASLDTYAEALFRAGRQDDAVAAMRRAQKFVPEDATLKQRLVAFEAGKLVVPDEPE